MDLLLQRTMAHGCRTELWTAARIAEVIERHFGVKHHRRHVGRVMPSLGWLDQKPERHAAEWDASVLPVPAKALVCSADEWERMKQETGFGPKVGHEMIVVYRRGRPPAKRVRPPRFRAQAEGVDHRA